MEKHALAVLNVLDSRMPLESFEANHQGITGRLLRLLIIESEDLGGSILEEFWQRLGSCHSRLEENICTLKAAPKFVSEKATIELIFKAVTKTTVSCEPLFLMAGKYFTALGFAFMDPRDEVDDDPIDDDRDDQTVSESAETLRNLVLDRDGCDCVITGLPLEYPPTYFETWSECDKFNSHRHSPVFAKLIPDTISKSAATLECIASLLGDKTLHLVLKKINTILNAMVIESLARFHFDQLLWAIDATTSSDGKVNYVFRRFYPTRSNTKKKYYVQMDIADSEDTPLEICFDEGEEVKFGKGPAAERLGRGPLPEFCKIRLSVTRIMALSGATDLFLELVGQDIDMSKDVRETAVPSFYLQLACLYA